MSSEVFEFHYQETAVHCSAKDDDYAALTPGNGGLRAPEALHSSTARPAEQFLSRNTRRVRFRSLDQR
jgi:hypothetical protein